MRPDCIIATGRSDYPNQVNNALCFPYIFRGALDVGATEINEAMKLACVRAIATLARMESSDLASAYGGEVPKFGPEYLIPRPFDPRLLVMLAPAVAQAAMESGIATRPIADFNAYEEKLGQFIYRTGLVMKPFYDRARGDSQRVVYAEGEEETVLRAVQTVIDEDMAFPILIGRPDVIESRIERLGLRMRPGVDFELTNINDDPRFNDYWHQYHALDRTPRRHAGGGEEPDAFAPDADRRADGRARRSRRDDLRPRRPLPQEARLPAQRVRARSRRDEHVGDDRRDQRAGRVVLPRHARAAGSHRRADRRSTLQASYRLKLFGIEPKVALLSHSNFGSHDDPSARKMRQVREILKARVPKLEVDGEMMADTAWDEDLRLRIMPNTTLKGRANLYVLPNLDSANITYNMVRVMTDGVAIGPILMGIDQPAHILTPASTPRRVVNMTAIAAVEAQIRKQQRSRMSAALRRSGFSRELLARLASELAIARLATFSAFV